MSATVPPLNRSGHTLAVERYPIACASSARVLDAEGLPEAAETVRHIGAHISGAPQWPTEVCMCAVVPCTEKDWTHPGHCCRVTGDHGELFTATHVQVCGLASHRGSCR